MSRDLTTNPVEDTKKVSTRHLSVYYPPLAQQDRHCDTGELAKKVMAHDILAPEKWKVVYDDLMEVCKFLLPKVEGYYSNGFKQEELKKYVRVFMMLNAYALENLLKGVFVKQNFTDIKSQVEKNHELPKQIKGHDLVKIAERIKHLAFNAEELNALKRLSRYTTWQAKYPTPMLHEALKLDECSWEGGKGIVSELFCNHDPEVIDSIHAKARALYASIMSAEAGNE